MVFQGAMNAFNPVKTIGAQIVEPMELHGTASGRAARAQVRELLELVGISGERADRYPHEFSGGMRQRAAIALALACQPQVLLADEPTTALDVMVQAQILELLVRLTRDLGLSHDPGHARPAGRGPGVRPRRRDVRRRDRRDGRRWRRSTTTRGIRTRACCSRRLPTCSGDEDVRLDPRGAAAARSRDRRLPVHTPLRLGVLALPDDASAPARDGSAGMRRSAT